MKIGFTCSTFDLFHAGHLLMLEEAKKRCDYLIVGLQTDPTIDRPIEKNKPIQSVFERFVQLEACKYVDITGKYECINKGIEFYFNRREHFFSTTELRGRVVAAEVEKGLRL